MMDDKESDVETQLCSNCKRDIPSANFMMHQTHCHRNIILCKSCKEPVPRSEMDNHVEEQHVKVTCKCGVAVEKCHIEDHEANSCSKRKQSCEYCELEMDAYDMADHVDFCGSRTEPCPNCQRYIMFKDLKQHEESMCTFPETKTETPKNVSQGADYFPDEFFMDMSGPPSGLPYEYYNPYVESNIQNDFRRHLPSTGQKATNLRSRPTWDSSGRNPPASNSLNNLKKTTSRKGPVARTRNRTRGSEVKSTTRPGMEGMSTTRPKNQPELPMSSHNHEEMDRLLAMHLAHDLTTDEDIDRIIEDANQIPDPPVSSVTHSRLYSRGPPSPTGDDMNTPLPCEFCSELFPLDILYVHQSGCSQAIPEDEHITNSPPNNSVFMSPNTRSPPSQPPIVDNLGYGIRSQADQFERPDSDDDDEIFLPCEFCETLLPETSLVQHQAMCESSTTPLPPALPEMPPRQMRAKPKPRDAMSHDMPLYSNRSARHQADPVMDFRIGNGDRSPTRPTQTKKSNPMASTVYGNRGVIQNRTRNKKTSSSRPSPSSNPKPPRITSAERTRKTLDELLTDENIDTEEILQHMDGEMYSRDSGHTRDNGYYGNSHALDDVDEDPFGLQSSKSPHYSSSQRHGRWSSHADSTQDPIPASYEASFLSQSAANRTKKVSTSNPRSRPPKSKSGSTRTSTATNDSGAARVSRNSHQSVANEHSNPPRQRAKKPANYRQRYDGDI
ncbi:TRAF-type zinc finger domain-containing protein 1-like [Saccoglossus kowalevskii]|uniref:TRAF-type zinc finger domain-containing protein 1-like n=1 Tax=Saccoglossus kowalevskii TaxID=10224 RepID=A0ABM0MNP5_SACKO|nr:PREDICTED: TRAF-type zinc finger domain-containing protein 1-like [Saccoglossus kowalevskii]